MGNRSNDNHLSKKALAIRALLSREMNSSGMDAGVSAVVRTIIFNHTTNTDEFWENDVPKLLKQWMPELTIKVDEILDMDKVILTPVED